MELSGIMSDDKPQCNDIRFLDLVEFYQVNLIVIGLPIDVNQYIAT